MKLTNDVPSGFYRRGGEDVSRTAEFRARLKRIEEAMARKTVEGDIVNDRLNAMGLDTPRKRLAHVLSMTRPAWWYQRNSFWAAVITNTLKAGGFQVSSGSAYSMARKVNRLVGQSQDENIQINFITEVVDEYKKRHPRKVDA